jgi:hypothetical protein
MIIVHQAPIVQLIITLSAQITDALVQAHFINLELIAVNMQIFYSKFNKIILF